MSSRNRTYNVYVSYHIKLFYCNIQQSNRYYLLLYIFNFTEFINTSLNLKHNNETLNTNKHANIKMLNKYKVLIFNQKFQF